MATTLSDRLTASTIDTGVPRMWAHAVSRYQELAATKLPHPTSIQSIPQLFDEVLSASDRFKNYRHDGSKVDRLRSYVARCLGPLQQLGTLVTQATKTVYPPTEAIFAAMNYLISSATATSADYEALELVFDDLQSQLQSLKILETKLSHFPELEPAVVGIFTSALVLCGICTQYIRKRRIRKTLRALVSGRDEKLKQATNDFHRSVRLGNETTKKLLLASSVDLKLATSSTLQHVANIDGSSEQMVRQLKELKISQERNETSLLSTTRKPGNGCYAIQAFVFGWMVTTTQYSGVGELDECAEGTRAEFLNLLLASRSTLRLFFTSRRSVDLHDRLGVSSSIEITASTSDIREYLATGISQNERLSSILQIHPDLRDQIIDTVQIEADGMFLLANLQLTHIGKQNTAKKVRNALCGLPRGIAAFYEQAIQRIADQGEEDSVLAKRTLSLIFGAERSLNAAELLAALSVETGDSELDDENCPNLSTVLGVCVGLVRVDDNSGTIGLVHKTLQEYLQENIMDLLPDLHWEMTKVSITYLSFRYFAEGPCAGDITLEERLQQYPFLEYASKNWGIHARYSGRQSLASVMAFLGSGANLASSVQVMYSSAKRTNGWHGRFPDNFGPLHAAAYWGLEEACEILCEGSYNIDAQDSQGTTALHLAAQQGHTALLESLLARGARADLANEKGYTALIWAGRNGHTASITPLLLAHRNILTHDVEGWTALDWAITGRHYDTAKVLLAHYSQASEVARLNKSLMLAAEAGNDEAVEILLSKGADVNGIDEEGSTALDFAVSEGKEEVVRLLLERGANPNSGDNYGHTSLHWALAHPFIAMLLLQYGATIDVKNRQKQTPLLWSAKEAQIDMMVLLIESGAAVNACDEHGITALHAAAAKGDEAMVKTLLDNGADATLEDRDGWTPVHAALVGGHNHLLPVFVPIVNNCQGIADALLKRLEDENNAAWLQEIAMAKSEGSVQVSGLRTAVNSGHSERVLALINAGEDINACDSIGGSTALTLATWLRRLNIARILIENGADVDRPDGAGNTALHIAARDGYEDIVALLVRNGATIDKPLHSWTPLLLASKDSHHDCCARIAELLVDNGADVNAADYHGRTALHWAAWWGQFHLAWELLRRDALVDAQDRWGMTPLVWASASEHTRSGNPVTNLLLDHNANANVETKNGYRAIHLAVLAGDVECLDKLLRHEADPEARIGTIGLTSLDIARIMKHEAAVKLLEEWGGLYSQPPQWQHAQNMALIYGNGGGLYGDTWVPASQH
ncbi:AGC PKA kinase [Apiospora aurea]|uniref:AGC PKA kinase n=1 Tax=Apiospora aurea TaxID=335848 RepID=A0ABR1QY85_9PEZI